MERQEFNLRPLPCRGSALTLSYAPSSLKCPHKNITYERPIYDVLYCLLIITDVRDILFRTSITFLYTLPLYNGIVFKKLTPVIYIFIQSHCNRVIDSRCGIMYIKWHYMTICRKTFFLFYWIAC